MSGHDMPTNTVPARLALRFECELVPARAERLSGGRYRITLYPPVLPDDGIDGAAAHEIDAQSQVGEVYLRSLLRAQLRLALVVVALLAVLVGGLPLAFWLLPEVMDQEVLGMPLAWGLLGFLVYPVLVAIGWWYVRAAERNERAFTDVVERL